MLTFRSYCFQCRQKMSIVRDAERIRLSSADTRNTCDRKKTSESSINRLLRIYKFEKLKKKHHSIFLSV